MLDAYTVRKAVPRILIAVIGINLSIYLCLAALDIATIIGRGIDGLLMSTFKDAHAFAVVSPETTKEGVLTTLLAGGAVWALGGAIVGGLLGFISLVGLLALAIMFTLIITQALIIFLTIVSPVAIACFILPGTEKYFQKWLDLFIKTLMIYPIVYSILAMSKVMAAILIGTSSLSPDGIGGAKVFAAILVIFAPLVLIPFAFKLAGGAIGQLGSMATGRAQQTGAGIRKGMRENPDSLSSRLRDSFDERRSRRGLSGRALQTRAASTFNSRERRAGRLAQVRQQEDARFAQKRSSQLAFQTNKEDDKFGADLAMYASGAESRAAIEDGTHISLKSRAAFESDYRKANGLAAIGPLTAAQQAAKDNYVNTNYSNAQRQLMSVSAAADRTGRGSAIRSEALTNPNTIGYALAEGAEGWSQFEKASNSIYGAGDSPEKRALKNKFQALSKGAGRFDLAAATDEGSYDADRAWSSGSLYQHANAKSNNIKAHVAQAKKLLASTDAADRTRGATMVEEFKAMQPNAIGGIADTINGSMDELTSLRDTHYAGITGTSAEQKQETYEETIATPTGSETVKRSRLVTGPGGAPVYLSNAEVERRKVQEAARTYERPDPNNI